MHHFDRSDAVRAMRYSTGAVTRITIYYSFFLQKFQEIDLKFTVRFNNRRIKRANLDFPKEIDQLLLGIVLMPAFEASIGLNRRQIMNLSEMVD